MFAVTTLVLFIINRQCRTITNLLLCNTVTAAILYYVPFLFSVAYSLSEGWSSYQPACILRGYIFTVACTALCYSYLIQTISRLFFCVFFKCKKLQTWFVHWIMILINWILAFVIPLVPIIYDGYIFEDESRLCIPTTKNIPSALYVMCLAYILPTCALAVIYGIILRHIRQSSRRIVSFVAETSKAIVTTNQTLPNYKREIEILKKVFVLLNILIFAGSFYVISTFWNWIQPQAAPKFLCSVAIEMITIFIAVMLVTLFFMSKDLRIALVNYISCVH
ncbi:unnamed protein product [Adineta ricciae]|uniref:G-protein coupled receptors family 1 profile domain-containing protein n=1 Tax=Adineta ricciae TaxID=249248 RepID=A0A815EMK9_ADIRI|nr:unnamed protein product [Adineta ricciae]